MKHLFAPWRMKFIRSVHEEEGGCFFCRYRDEPEENDAKNLVLLRGSCSMVVLNRFPYNSGHLMIAPYRHGGRISDLGDDELVEMMKFCKQMVELLTEVGSPHGFNIGFNIGRAAGAGVSDHIHMHIVPRWQGDTNFMPVLGETRVLPQSLEDTYKELKKVLERG